MRKILRNLAHEVLLPEIVQKFEKKTYSRGEIALLILKVLAVSGMAVAVFAMPGLAGVLQLFHPKDRRQRAALRRTIGNLREKKAITIVEQGNKTVITITNRGKRMLLKYDIDHLEIKKPKQWDRQWRIVAFDIPEKYRRARWELNFRLRDLGFYPLQKSLFVFPYECRREIEFVAEYFFIRKYVTYIIAQTVDGEEHLKRIYHLQ